MDFSESVKKLKASFAANRLDESRRLLIELVEETHAMDPEQGAAAYLELMTVYLSALTAVNKNYLATLDESVSMLKTLRHEEQTMKDSLALDRVSREIDDLRKGD